MPRVTDVNVLLYGYEPKCSGEMSKLDMMKTLTWYSQNKDSKDAFKYSCEFFKKKFKLDASSVLKNEPSTFGFVCRIVTNGGVLVEQNKTWFDKEIERIKNLIDTQEEKTVVVNDNSNTPSIQDRIKEKSSECIGELEGMLDDLILSSFTANVAPYSILHTMEIKGVHTRFILEKFKTKRAEFDEILHTDDKELRDAYSNFTKPQLKKVVSFCDQIILDCQKIVGESVKSRKPRKRKVKSPAQLVSKIKILDKFEELNLKSIEPTEIIGSNQLWVFNVKTRKIGVYHAEDAAGLSIKGSSIINFNESKSLQKKVRKPETLLPEIIKGGKVFLRNALGNIRAVESALTGRLNGDTILLRVLK